MKIKRINDDGQADGFYSVPDEIFAKEYNAPLVHQIVIAYQANARSGNRKQKTRGEVAHSTKKPWRQKGTGRARSGMRSSPLWRGGGRTFPNTPDENFSHKVNRKMYRAGVCTILSELVRKERLCVLPTFQVESPKTRLVDEKIKRLNITGSILLLTAELDDNLYLSSRNLPHLLVLKAKEIDPGSLVRFDHTIVTESALDVMKGMFL